MPFTITQLVYLTKLVDTTPATKTAGGTTGELLLVNGRSMIGSWDFHTTAELCDFVEATGGKRWFIPLVDIVAFQPQPTATPQVEPANAEQHTETEANDAGGEAQPSLRQETWDPTIGSR